uniref:ZP domain-containing protein n=1 Tax=Ascaris lumbricoides TaxID=6252 RepID=A0A0M3ICL9_ASCLU
MDGWLVVYSSFDGGTQHTHIRTHRGTQLMAFLKLHAWLRVVMPCETSHRGGGRYVQESPHIVCVTLTTLPNANIDQPTTISYAVADTYCAANQPFNSIIRVPLSMISVALT